MGGTVTIADSAPIGGATVTLLSSDPIAKAPYGVVIPSGQTAATFTITTSAVTAARTVTITATYGSLPKQSATLTVSATGTVTLGAAAPLGGITVTLQSSSLAIAQMPSSVTVQQGATSASFTIQTFHVTSTQTVTITATAGVVKQTAVLTVQ